MFSRSELSGEERADCLAPIRSVGITVSGLFDSGIDGPGSVSFLIVSSFIAKRIVFLRSQNEDAPQAMLRSRRHRIGLTLFLSLMA